MKASRRDGEPAEVGREVCKSFQALAREERFASLALTRLLMFDLTRD